LDFTLFLTGCYKWVKKNPFKNKLPRQTERHLSLYSLYYAESS